MIENPRLAICLLTYRRTDEALRTIRGLCENLDYQPRGWYIADDGSSRKHIAQLLTELNLCGEEMIGYHNKRYSPKTGIGWNKGLGACFQWSDFVLVMEDDKLVGIISVRNVLTRNPACIKTLYPSE